MSFGSFDLADIKFSELFPVLVAVSVTLGLLIYHIINMTQSLSYMYRSGYAESAKFQEIVRAKVSAAAGTERYGSPCGGLQHGLLPGTFELGRWLRPDETMSESVFITVDWNTHISGALHGLRRCHSFRIFLQWYGPIVLALWALASVAV